MMSLPSINNNAAVNSTIIMGGEVWPGLAVVECDVSRAVDLQKRKGDDGANLVDQGYEPAKVKITLTGWLDEQQAELERLLPTIHPRRKGGIRTPVDIFHIVTEMVSVRQIYITKIGPLVLGTGNMFGSWTFAIEAVEWFPEPKPAKSKPKKSKTGGDLPDLKDDLINPGKNGSAGGNIF